MSQTSFLEEYLTPRVFEVRTLQGGTVRAYEVGPPDVPVVVGIHGTPGTGLGHLASYVASGAFFCRLVTFDRQGYGGSTPEPGRKVSDIAPVVESILDHLAIDRAAIYGHSGGGMLALASAALLPKRITSVACVAGNGPNYGKGDFDYADGPSPLMREEIIEARKGPEASREFYRRVIANMRGPEFEQHLYSENDRRVNRLLDPLKNKISQQLGLAGSSYSEEDAYVDDAQSWVSPWGFELGSITVPARIFFGLEDLMVARQHSEWFKNQIVTADLALFPHFGHSLSPLMPHVLAWLFAGSMTMQVPRAAGH